MSSVLGHPVVLAYMCVLQGWWGCTGVQEYRGRVSRGVQEYRSTGVELVVQEYKGAWEQGWSEWRVGVVQGHVFFSRPLLALRHPGVKAALTLPTSPLASDPRKV